MSIDRLVVATNNLNKVKEIKDLVGSTNVISLNDLGVVDIYEYGTTLEENAKIKSNYVFDKFKIPCIGDDSGLFIPALNFEPGVYSARYAGTDKNDKANIEKVLDRMKNTDNREAYFKTVIAYTYEQGCVLFEGILEGKITLYPKGNNGFGYDPIFEPLDSKLTLAEMDVKQKNDLSHRAKAIRNFLEYINLNRFC
jgi:XTP/dITP diphosphohydrolase